MAKEKMGFWLDDGCVKAIREFSEDLGVRMTDVVEALIPRGAWVQALAHAGLDTPMVALYQLASRGLAATMAAHIKPVSSWRLQRLAPAQVAEEYVHFLDAINYDLGLMGLDGEPPRWRFEPVPAKDGQPEQYTIVRVPITDQD